MGILDRILRAGEGKKIKALEGIVPDINAFEPEIEALSDDALKAKTNEFRQRLDNGAETSTTCWSRRSPSRREAADPGHRPAPLRRAD